MCTQKMRALSYIGAGKITFPPKPDIQTDSRHTYIHLHTVDYIHTFVTAGAMFTCSRAGHLD